MGVTSDNYPIINSDISVGSLCKSNNDGDVTVMSYRSTGNGKLPTIKFCSTGNEYEVTKDSLRRGIIADRNKDRTPEFVEKCREVHGDRYSYDKTVFKSVKGRVLITCKEHGDVYVTASVHLAGGKCKRCACADSTEQLRMSKSEFVDRVFSAHKGKIIPVVSSFSGTNSKARFICTKHGGFTSYANSILRGTGCRKCAAENSASLRTHSKESVKERFVRAHGGKYSYKWETYKSVNKPMTIICPEHGPWEQLVRNHVQCIGCPRCSRSGFDSLKDGRVYVLQSRNMVKVGITNREVSDRSREINKSSTEMFSEVTHFCLSGVECVRVEKEVLRWMRNNAKPAPEKFDGSSECFYLIGKDNVVAAVKQSMERTLNG